MIHKDCESKVSVAKKNFWSLSSTGSAPGELMGGKPPFVM
jgi:hypothetical protein